MRLFWDSAELARFTNEMAAIACHSLRLGKDAHIAPVMAKAQTCPLCKRPSVASFTPFCSQGCKDRDLLQWLGEGYKIPGLPADPDYPSEPSSED